MPPTGELSAALRFTLHPVPAWVDTVRRATGWGDPKARALLGALESAGKAFRFTDPDGVERIAHAGNWTPPEEEGRP
jgi:hypothetical protein